MASADIAIGQPGILATIIGRGARAVYSSERPCLITIDLISGTMLTARKHGFPADRAPAPGFPAIGVKSGDLRMPTATSYYTTQGRIEGVT